MQKSHILFLIKARGKPTKPTQLSILPHSALVLFPAEEQSRMLFGKLILQKPNIKDPCTTTKFSCGDGEKYPNDSCYASFWQEVKFFPFFEGVFPLMQHLNGLLPLVAYPQKFCELLFSDSCRCFLAGLGR